MCIAELPFAQAPAVDPFDALAGSLPSSEPVAPKGPRYTGPEIKEVRVLLCVCTRMCVHGCFLTACFLLCCGARIKTVLHVSA